MKTKDKVKFTTIAESMKKPDKSDGRSSRTVPEEKEFNRKTIRLRVRKPNKP